MRRIILSFSQVVLVLSLGACDRADQPENSVAAEDLNVMANLEEAPPVAPAENIAAEDKASETRQTEPAATKPAPKTTAPAKPKPTPPEPETKPTAEPKAADPTCAPEHRAAGHC